MMRSGIGLALGAACLGLACSNPDDGEQDAPGPGDGADGDTLDALDVRDTTPEDVAAWGARLHGVVWGPHPDDEDPLFPVSGAAVMAHVAPPDAIPEEAYCEPCMELPDEVRYAYSAADGSFTLEIPVGTTVYLTVQKGQFRRVTEYTAPADPGDYDLGEELTTLPHANDAAAGDTIPRIALVFGDYDHIEDVLVKVGLGEDDGAYGLLWGSETGFFDVFDNSMPGSGTPHHGERINNLLLDPVRMNSYHVILFACSYNANFAFMQNAEIQANLRDFVWRGGKLYVSDYAMPVAEMPWHDFAWFTDPLHGGCSEVAFPPNCNHGPPFDAPGNVLDADLSAWLDGKGLLTDLEIRENWDTIGAVDSGYVGDDPITGEPREAPPTVWVEGPWDYPDSELIDLDIDPAEWDRSPHPFTLSWQHNCGRVLFTTYHTVGTTDGGRHPGLLPQELVLFYLIMEMTVCQDEPVLI